MDLADIARSNMQRLRSNPYPGRGIVIGLTPDGRHYVQLYWTMGRSENSRDRVFVREGDLVRTSARDPSAVRDTSLIIYNCVRTAGRCHIVSNGDQTDTVLEALGRGESFEAALCTRTFEPDAPNYTPRITGLVNLDDEVHAYKLSIIKAVNGNPSHCLRQFFNYEMAIPGFGHCLTTYSGDGRPLPSFEGEPCVVELADNIAALVDVYWDALDADNKVSLLAKFIRTDSGETSLRIINKRGAD